MWESEEKLMIDLFILRSRSCRSVWGAGETGTAVTFIQFIQSLYIQSKLTYTHSCTRTQTQKTTNLNSVNCILNNTLRTHTLCYMQMHSKNYTHTHVNKERVREGTNVKDIMKVIVFFSKTCSLF